VVIKVILFLLLANVFPFLHTGGDWHEFAEQLWFSHVDDLTVHCKFMYY